MSLPEECDTCPCVAAVTLFHRGKPVGKRCHECFRRLERKVALGALEISDDPLDGIHLSWLRKGFMGEA